MDKRYILLAILVVLVIYVFSGNKGTSPQVPAQSLGGKQAILQIGAVAPDATFTTIDGEEHKLSEYRGNKVMLFVLATWCQTCQQGARALQENNGNLQNIEFIIVKTYKNAGYPGPSIREFAQSYAPKMLNVQNWVFGDLSEESTRLWNPKNYPDIYWLIDEQGIVRHVSGAPTATMGLINQFAQSQETKEPLGEEFAIIGRDHVAEGTSITDYNSNPPTSGPHWPRPAEWGFYDEQLADEQLVHNLEHGGIWISYKSKDALIQEPLRALAQDYPNAVIVTYRPENDALIAVASWGRLMKLNQYDENLIKKFIQANVNNAPEPLADASKHK